MPSLEQALNADLTGYSAVVSEPLVNPPTPTSNMQPGRSSMLRCPLPILGAATPDALRSYYRNGQIPQTRLLTPQSSTGVGTASSASTSVITTSPGGSSGTSLTAAQATVTTAVIGPNQKFSGVITVAKSFQLLSCAVNNTARVQMYGTSVAQAADISRALDAAPPAGTAQNIICDVVLDTLPLQWSFQSRVGANQDNPQTSAIYVTITNLGTSSTAITLTFVYLPLEA